MSVFLSSFSTCIGMEWNGKWNRLGWIGSIIRGMDGWLAAMGQDWLIACIQKESLVWLGLFGFYLLPFV